jgi:ribosomal-protein-alanine N-acetyltransferase
MANSTLRIRLAAARNAPSVAERLEAVERFLAEAATRDVAIVCFPEAYIPGLRGCDFPVPAPDRCLQRQALEAVRVMARSHGVSVVIGMEWETALGLHNVASSSRVTARRWAA